MSADLRCNRCTGTGTTGRYERGKWRIRSCGRCGGSGQCHPEQRNAIYWTPARLARVRSHG